ncbi:hypothetical protein K435DRAFT_782852 [Dendrothele bispora CBS 962.96]|uniref:ABM domain-containing protein n=1 Tax=Dendrothele bispora (strain CBS 962.96) TaxID=1314807 RepID=A0A4S8LC93_DENBC|nr:hypothetical protein K435DRAFT_782852 [Dendrothele bispora CBS 962.96]
MADNLPERTSSGKLMVIVHINVKSGKEARFEELATASKVSANSDKEPGTLTFRVTRVVDNNAQPVAGKYIAIEEYAGKPELLQHFQTPAQQELMKEAGDLLESTSLEIVDEF